MHEINLLPPSRRQRLRRQRVQDILRHFLRHLQTALLLMVFIMIVIGVGIQLMIILSPNEGAAEVVSLVRQYQQKRQSIISKNLLIEEVRDAGKDRIVWSEYISDILNVLPPGTTIKEVRGSVSPRQLTFTGVSVNRNSLIILGTRLEGLSWAQEVQNPLENLLARDNPEYSFTVKLNGVSSSPTEANSQDKSE